MSTIDHLIRMANQIARELGNQNPERAVEATSAHLRRYWDPAMRARIVAYLEEGGDGLHDIARDAVRLLRPTTTADDAAHAG